MANILMIEDDLDILKYLRLLLEDENFKVRTAVSRKEALAQLEQHSFDLILLDLTLPDGNGYSLCTEIRRQQDIPVIFLTAMNDEASIVTIILPSHLSPWN